VRGSERSIQAELRGGRGVLGVNRDGRPEEEGGKGGRRATRQFEGIKDENFDFLLASRTEKKWSSTFRDGRGDRLAGMKTKEKMAEG